MVQILIGTKSSHDFFDADTYELDLTQNGGGK